jgi:hypothetical protein
VQVLKGGSVCYLCGCKQRDSHRHTWVTREWTAAGW